MAHVASNGQSANLMEVNKGVEATTNGSTLYIKNLNFNTTDKGLQRAALEQGVNDMRSVAIARKTNTKGTGSLSTGFGFIEFNSHVGAVDGMRKLDGSIVDGHQIQCKISVGQASDAARSESARRTKRNTADGGATGVRSTVCTKLVVRNVAFEATS